MTLSNKEKNLIDLCAQGKTSHYSDCDLTMKFWRLMGFITTGGPAVRGHAWNFLSVSSHHPLFETVPGVVPGYQIKNVKTAQKLCHKQFHQTPLSKLTSKYLFVRNGSVTYICNSKACHNRPYDVLSRHSSTAIIKKIKL